MVAGAVLAVLMSGNDYTGFQSAAPYADSIDVRSDVAIVYGVDGTLEQRVAGWKDRGYRIHVMTGSAWGHYDDYFAGRYDGVRHDGEGQVGPDGQVIWHNAGTVPYVVPTDSYIEYLCTLAKRAVDAGAVGLHLEEPEFWSRAGYSEGFKRLWLAEYGREWQRPDSSPDAFWRAAKLKYMLYKRTLGRVFDAAKNHAHSRGQELKCFVPTHSLVNYSQWSIVSPESSLMDLPNCDGYIAQVWTGTARTPNTYRGIRRERTFETAYLEYSSTYHMVAPTGRTVYFLADPVEDDPGHTWDDYRANYERVLVASLLFPEVHHYEVMPWPERVMTGKYPAGAYAPKPDEKIGIPPDYWRELMVCVNALNEMGQAKWRWKSGAGTVGLLVSDTMMFQRGGPWSGPITFDEFYGTGLPLVKHGVDTRCVVLERIMDGHALRGIPVLLMSYEHMKPLRSEYNEALADWVRGGGVLVYFGDDKDAFNRVEEWWGRGTPRADLYTRLGATTATATIQRIGKGALIHTDETPARLARRADGPACVMDLVGQAMQQAGQPLAPANHFLLERGPYVMGAVVDETSGPAEQRVPGLFANLFSRDAAIVENPVFRQGDVFLLRRIVSAQDTTSPTVLVSTARVDGTETSSGVTVIRARGPAGEAPGFMRIQCGSRPGSVLIDARPADWSWDEKSCTARVEFRHVPGGNRIEIR